VAGVTLATGEALVAAAAVFEGSFGGPLTTAAAASARPPGRHAPVRGR